MLSEYRAACVLNMAVGILDYERWRLLCPSTIIAAAESLCACYGAGAQKNLATGHTRLSMNIDPLS